MAYQNFFAAKLYTDIGSSDTTITLDTAPTATSGRMVLEARNPTQREVIKYTGVSGNQLTGVTRGQGGTTAKAHLKNALIEMNLVAEDIQDLYDAYQSFAGVNSDWRNITQTPIFLQANGQREYLLKYPSIDLTNILLAGSKLKVPRTTSIPTMSAAFNAASNQYASKTNPTNIAPTDTLTIEAMVKVKSYKNATIIGRNVASYANGFRMGIDAQGIINIYGYNGGTYRGATSLQSLPLNRWVHVTATLSMSANTQAIYFDGVSVPIAQGQSGTPATSINNAGDLSISFDGNGTASCFDGSVSEARIWNTQRSAAQVRDTMYRQLVGNETGLIGYWKLNGDFLDSTSNANNLTPGGGASATTIDNPISPNEYLIVSSVIKSGGDTLVTGVTPTGSGIPNETLGASSYSNASTPIGFPDDKARWYFDAIYIRDTTITNPNAGTIYSIGQLSLPQGKWELYVEGNLAMQRIGGSAGDVEAYTGLSTVSNGMAVINNDSTRFYTWDYTSVGASVWVIKRLKLGGAMSQSSQQNIFFNIKAQQNALQRLGFRGDASGTAIYAIPAYAV